MTPDWDGLWRTNTTPWDLGGPTPALEDLIAERPEWFAPDTSALVPGCGQAHDVLLLARHCRHVTGIDISPKAVETALGRARGIPNVLLLCQDFLAQEPTARFDVVFDYT
jgi:methyl halide transferase